MRFTLRGALQGDVKWEWISYSQRQSYIAIKLNVQIPRINLPTILDLQLRSMTKEINLNSVIMDLSCPLLTPSNPLRHGEGRKICPLINPSAAAHRSTHKERNEGDILSPVCTIKDTFKDRRK